MASSVGPSDDRYSSRDPFRGLLVVISNEIFQDPSNPRRGGTERDVERLQKTFGQLGFRSQIFRDQTCLQMLQIMDKVVGSGKNLEEYDCLAVVILTHGKDGNRINGVGPETKDGKDMFTLDKILAPLKSIEKEMPKLVFVQACRGNELDEGHYVEADNHGESRMDTEDSIRVVLENDFLHCFSTCPGYYSFRNKNGSIFIQSLCNIFDSYTEQNLEIDVLKALIQVNYGIAKDYESSTLLTNPEFHDKKQMPSFVCMLRKSVFLKKQQQ